MNITAFLPELELFVATVDGGSFSAAAQRVGLSPSAVSRAIGRLEAGLKGQLLTRTTRSFALTDLGEATLAQARIMLEAAGQIAAFAEGVPTRPAGRLALAAPRALGALVIHPVMMRYLDLCPEVRPSLVYEDRPVDLIAEKIDIAISITAKPPAGGAGRLLGEVGQILCASPDYLATAGTPRDPRNLSTHALICLSDTSADCRLRFERGSQQRQIRVSPTIAVNHSGLRLAHAQAHRGIAVLPRFVAAEALARGEIVTILPEWRLRTHFEGMVWALYRPHPRLSPQVRGFVDFLASELAGNPALSGTG